MRWTNAEEGFRTTLGHRGRKDDPWYRAREPRRPATSRSPPRRDRRLSLRDGTDSPQGQDPYHPSHEGIDFLGYTISKQLVPGRGDVVYTYPSRRSLARIKDRVQELTASNTTNLELAEILCPLNTALQGWGSVSPFRFIQTDIPLRRPLRMASCQSVDHALRLHRRSRRCRAVRRIGPCPGSATTLGHLRPGLGMGWVGDHRRHVWDRRLVL